jgi:phosphatidylserine decarboxylase
MVPPPRVPRWIPALRYRRPNTPANYSTQPQFVDSPRQTWRKRDLVLRGPALLLRGPGLLLRAPKAVLRAPGAARARTQRLFSSATSLKREQRIGDQGIEQPQAGPSSSKGKNGGSGEKASFTCESLFASSSFTEFSSLQRLSPFAARLRQRWQETPVKWAPIPVSLGAAVLVVLTFYKQASEKGKEPYNEGSVKVEGPWQVSIGHLNQSSYRLRAELSCHRFTSLALFLFDRFRDFTVYSTRTLSPSGSVYLDTNSTRGSSVSTSTNASTRTCKSIGQ